METLLQNAIVLKPVFNLKQLQRQKRYGDGITLSGVWLGVILGLLQAQVDNLLFVKVHNRKQE